MEISKELAVISLTLDESTAPLIFERITADMFTAERYKAAYSTALSLYKQHGAVDIVKLLDQINFQEEYKTIFKQEIISAIQEDTTLKAYRNDIDNVITGMIDNKIKSEMINAALTGGTSSEIAETISRIYTDNAARVNSVQDLTAAEYMESGFFSDLREFQNNKELKTGFTDFDEHTGGLYSGLYVVGAISSLGKTTFIHQLADNIATSGRRVLYFSLEMSRDELITKSISRIAYLNSNKKYAPTSLEIRKHGLETDEVKQAYSEYKNTAGKNMIIIQGDFNTTVDTVREKLKKQRAAEPDQAAPVVIIDYLQILKPSKNARGTTKEEIDYNVSELKRISRDFNTPVIVISSFNRANYENVVSFESFKESGGIEYTCDVLIGLQLGITGHLKQSQGYTNINREYIERAKDMNPRIIDLKILKNRYGRNGSMYLTFDGVHSLFESRNIKAHEELQPLIREYEKTTTARKKAKDEKKKATPSEDDFFNI